MNKKIKIFITFLFIILLLISGYFLWKLDLKEEDLSIDIISESSSELSIKEFYESTANVPMYNEELFDYLIKGITDGVPVDEPFAITSHDGRYLASNVLSYNLYYLDQYGILRSIAVPLLIRLPDNSLFTTDVWIYNRLTDVYGPDFIEEEVVEHIITRYIDIPGKVVAMNFYSNEESLDSYLHRLDAADVYIPPNTYRYRQFEFLREYLEDRQNELVDMLKAGDTNLKYILPNTSSSSFVTENPEIVDLDGIDLKNMLGNKHLFQ